MLLPAEVFHSSVFAALRSWFRSPWHHWYKDRLIVNEKLMQEVAYIYELSASIKSANG